MQTEKTGYMTDVMAGFIGHMAKVLPDDVISKLKELREAESDRMAAEIYALMFRNLEMAAELDRPACQDTGILQFLIRCGSRFPLIDELEDILISAVRKATSETPLRPNVVETFDEYNTGDNTGKGAPSIWWELVPASDQCEIYTYFAGGGCSLPGQSTVLMPGQGYPEAIRFVLDRITSYGLNACPPLLVGVGIGNSSEVAAMNAKHALLRPVGSHNENKLAADLEDRLEESINNIGIGPQGLGGSSSVMGVNIVNTARHPATLAVGFSVSCWCHRRGRIVFDSDLSFTCTSHSGFRSENIYGRSGQK